MSVCGALLLSLAVVATAASPGWAGPPTDQLKIHIDRALAALQDPAFKDREHRARRQAVVRESMEAIIDFDDMARRVLGPAWAARTPAEREEFSAVFGDFLKAAYVAQIDLYRGEKLLWDGERIEDDQATVLTRIEWMDGDRSPVEFKMLRGVNDAWRVYDVTVDGVSLLDNYRAQFRAVLRRSPYADLVKQIKAQTPRSR